MQTEGNPPSYVPYSGSVGELIADGTTVYERKGIYTFSANTEFTYTDNDGTNKTESILGRQFYIVALITFNSGLTQPKFNDFNLTIPGPEKAKIVVDEGTKMGYYTDVLKETLEPGITYDKDHEQVLYQWQRKIYAEVSDGIWGETAPQDITGQTNATLSLPKLSENDDVLEGLYGIQVTTKRNGAEVITEFNENNAYLITEKLSINSGNKFQIIAIDNNGNPLDNTDFPQNDAPTFGVQVKQLIHTFVPPQIEY
jgi:hypothetical protein